MPVGLDSTTLAYWLIAFVIVVIVTEEMVRRFRGRQKE
jgi:hypothetical protein